MDMVFQARLVFPFLNLFRKDGHVAGPWLEDFPNQFEHDRHRCHIAVRTEIGAPLGVDGARFDNTGEWLVGHADAGIGLPIFQHHIVAWLVFLDETVLQQQGILLGLYNSIGDIAYLADKHFGLEAVNLLMEIGGHATLQVLGLAHVDDDAILIPVLITTGLLWHIIHNVLEPFPQFLLVSHTLLFYTSRSVVTSIPSPIV